METQKVQEAQLNICPKESAGQPLGSGAQAAARLGGKWNPEIDPVNYLVWGAFILAAILRFYHIGEQSLWMDEIMTMAASTGHFQNRWAGLPSDQILTALPDPTAMSQAKPWWVLWQVVPGDVHPPLYYHILRLWRDVFGDGATSGRALSAVASLIAIGLLFDLGRLLYGKVAGFWAALLMAMAVPQVAFAQELRSYTPMLAFALGAAVALVRIEQFGPNRKRLLGLGGCCAAVALTHYFSFGALLALGIYALARFRGVTLRRVLQSFALAALVFLVLGGRLIWAQHGEMNQPWLLDRYDRVPNMLWRLASIPGNLLVARQVNRTSLYYEPSMAHYLGLLCLLPSLLLWWRRKLLLPLLWLACTIGMVASLDAARATHHLYYTRYILLGGPGLYLLAAAAVQQKWVRHVLPAALVLCCWANLSSIYVPFRDDWRSAATNVAADNGEANEPLVFHTGYDWLSRTMYAGLAHYGAAEGRPVLFLRTLPASPQMLRELKKFGDHAWLITYRHEPVAEVLPGGTFTEQSASVQNEVAERVLLPDSP